MDINHLRADQSHRYNAQQRFYIQVGVLIAIVILWFIDSSTR